LANFLITALIGSTNELPYTVRLLAREALLALRVFYRLCLVLSDTNHPQVKYPDATDRELTPAVAKTVVLPFILPSIM
jgi:Ras GTPase-activating-like protein IQGAP2/3